MKKVISPIYVMLSCRRKIALNLNVYRNLHYKANNQAKKQYEVSMGSQLHDLKFPNPIHLEFVLYKPSKRKIDRANILCVVEKFFCDALTHYGCITDDNDNHIVSTYYTTGGIDKDNPRVEIFIKDRRENHT